MHDLEDLGVALPSGDYATIAGLVLDQLDRVPDGVGDSAELAGWRIDVRAKVQEPSPRFPRKYPRTNDPRCTAF